MTAEEFRDVVALWWVSEKSAADVVLAACDLLVEGVDGPAVSRLAAVSLREADTEMPVLLEDALLELGLTHHHYGTDAAKEAGLRAMCGRVLAGELRPRELTAWVHRTCGHDRLEIAGHLAVLDDEYDLEWQTSAEELDAEVLAEVRRITQEPGRWRPDPPAPRGSRERSRRAPGTPTA